MISSAENNSFFCRTAIDIPLLFKDRVWQAWEKLSEWQTWDASLNGAVALSDGLELGKHFSVLAKNAPAPVPVTVISFSRNIHFTTCSNNPLGLLAFGHTLADSPIEDMITLEHTIYAVPANATAFAAELWSSFKDDVKKSVASLAELVTEKESVA